MTAVPGATTARAFKTEADLCAALIAWALALEKARKA